MRYAQIRSMDISDGPGARVAIYVQGCTHHCRGCFNPETWDFNGGFEWTPETNETILRLMNKEYIAGLSILGGDPVCAFLHEKENKKIFVDLLKQIRGNYPNKTIWLWTGYYFEELVNMEPLEFDDTDIQHEFCELISLCDVIVDGPYLEKMRNPSLPYAGSENQRVVDVKKSVKENKIVIYKSL